MVLNVGVLALQGSFKEHIAALHRCPGVAATEVRSPAELEGLDALILPGGESTAIGLGLVDANLLEPVRKFCSSKPVWGICAGLILLADKLDGGGTQPLIGGLKVTVKRNAFGPQISSRYRSMELVGEAKGLNSASYFIRAPVLTTTGAGVKVLAKVEEGAVAVRQGKFLATCFHPEVIAARAQRRCCAWRR